MKQDKWEKTDKYTYSLMKVEESIKWKKLASNYKPDWIAPSNSYPGLWAKVPQTYFDFINQLIPSLLSNFSAELKNVKRVACNYALATTSHEELHDYQQIPHFDSQLNNQIAIVHYLCSQEFGGTGFYYHNSSEIEVVTAKNRASYVDTLSNEMTHLNNKSSQYIEDNHPLFTRTHYEQAQFGKLICYPGNLLHSACIPSVDLTVSKLTEGRLTITTFIELDFELRL